MTNNKSKKTIDVLQEDVSRLSNKDFWMNNPEKPYARSVNVV